MAYISKRSVLPVQTIYNPKHKDSVVGKLLQGQIVKLVVAFLLGISMGRLGRSSNCSTNNTNASTVPIHGSIQDYENLSDRKTSHGSITKRQFLEAFYVPRVTGFSIATIHPGDSVEVHDHYNMHEFFYVLEGEATFFVCQTEHSKALTTYSAKPGTFWHVVPHCAHGITVPANSTSGDLKIFYGGVTEDQYDR